MTMKNRKTLVAVAVLLVLALVFVAPVSAEDSLPSAVDGVISLNEDVVLTKGHQFTSGDITLNLNGFNITGSISDGYGLIYVGINGNLTVTGNGKIENTLGHAIGNYGKVTINGGDIVGKAALRNFNYDNSQQYAGTAIINGGTFTAYDDYLNSIENCGDLTVNGGTINDVLDTTAKLTVTSGTINTLYVKKGDYTPKFGVSTVISEDATITTIQATAQIGNNYYSTLSEAVTAVPENGDSATTITLLTDTKDSFDVGKSNGSPFKKITLNLNENTLTLGPGVGSVGTKSQGIRVLYKSELKIHNGAITCSDDTDDNVKIGIANYGKLVLDDVTVNSGSLVQATINNRAELTLSGTTTVEDGKDDVKVAVTNDPYDYYYTNQNAILTISDSTVTVGTVLAELYGNDQNSGTVELKISAGSIDKIIDDGTNALTPVKSITGGVYGDVVDSNFIADDYYLVWNTDATTAETYKYAVGNHVDVSVSLESQNGIPDLIEGDDLELVFVIGNNGNIPVNVSAITVTEGLTNTTVSSKLINPMETATFTVTGTALKAGTYTVAVTVEEFPDDTWSKVIFDVVAKEVVVPTPDQPTLSPSTSNGGKDTGSGNFAEYPRQADGTAGEIDFGSSKDVKSVDLPEGVTGAVTLVAKSNHPAPEGKDTHKVFEINIPNYPTGKPATIKFEMTLAEIEAKGLTAADVCLYHFDKETGVWTKLPTTYKVVDGKVYFEAVTTGFSPFAIVFEEGAATPAEGADEPVTPPTETPDVPGEDLPEIPDVPTTPEEPSSPAPILAVLAGLGAAVVLRRK